MQIFLKFMLIRRFNKYMRLQLEKIPKMKLITLKIIYAKIQIAVKANYKFLIKGRRAITQNYKIKVILKSIMTNKSIIIITKPTIIPIKSYIM